MVEGVQVLQTVTVFLGSLALVKPMFDLLRIEQIVDWYCPTQSPISHGRIAVILLANRLTSPRPLYNVEEWARQYAVEEVFGVAPDQLNDDRLARTLDAMYPYLEQIQGAITWQAIRVFGVDVSQIHYDLSSLYFEGDYEESSHIVRGYNRDGHPQEVQVVLGVNATADGGVLIRHQVHPGNTEDGTTVVDNLKALQGMLQTKEVILIGDRKVPSLRNVLEICQAGGYFVAAASLPDKVPQDRSHFRPIEYMAVRDAHKPPDKRARYRVWEEQIPIKDPQTGKVYLIRRIWVESSVKLSHDQKARGENIAKIQAGFERIASLLNKYDYTTKDTVRGRILRMLGGNPARGFFSWKLVRRRASGLLELTWRLDTKAVEKAALRDGLYTLSTNLEREGYATAAVFRMYKGQDQVEKRLSQLKGKRFVVRPLFLQKEERIDALVLIVVLGVMIFTLLERQVRLALEVHPEKLRDLQELFVGGGLTTRVTAERLFRAFWKLCVVRQTLCVGGEYRSVVCVEELSLGQRTVLQLLGFPLPREYLEDCSMPLWRSTSRCRGHPEVCFPACSFSNLTTGG